MAEPKPEPIFQSGGLQSAASGLQSVRRSMFRNLAFLVLMVGGVLFAVAYYGNQRTVVQLSASLIDSAGNQVALELRRFLDPVRNNLLIGAERGASGQLEPNDHAALNARFIPILRQNPQIDSLTLSEADGKEYLLMRDGEGWRNRLSRPDEWGSRSHWIRLGPQGKMLEEEWREIPQDPRTRPWFKHAISLQPGSMSWSRPYRFPPTGDPVISAALHWHSPADVDQVLALNVKLEDLSALVASLPVTDKGRLVVMTDETKVVGVTKNKNQQSARVFFLRAASLNIPELTAAVKDWEEQGKRSVAAKMLPVDGERYWAGFRPFDLDGGQRLWIGVVVPEGDFLGEARRQNRFLLLGAGTGLLLVLLLALVLERRLVLKVGEEVARVQHLGQYTLEEKLGEGGMGAVYRATHALLRRPTAIKLLHPEIEGDEEAIARFEQEVQVTSELSHPNTVRIYDFGRNSEGVFYYAMEYIDGIDLQRLVENYGPIAPERSLHVLRQVCGSLTEAHSFGLIHRDIKPANIMLCQRGGQYDVVKVMDFGMVKTSGRKGLDLTRANVVMGTPHYLAPEALRGSTDLDGRQDLYALGAVAWFMLMGRNLFTGDTPIDVARKHLSEEPPSIEKVYGRGMPEDLARVIMACLAKDPEQRPRDAAQLGDLLDECRCARAWSQQRAIRWWKDRSATLAAAPKAADLLNSLTTR